MSRASSDSGRSAPVGAKMLGGCGGSTGSSKEHDDSKVLGLAQPIHLRHGGHRASSDFL